MSKRGHEGTLPSAAAAAAVVVVEAVPALVAVAAAVAAAVLASAEWIVVVDQDVRQTGVERQRIERLPSAFAFAPSVRPFAKQATLSALFSIRPYLGVGAQLCGSLLQILGYLPCERLPHLVDHRIVGKATKGPCIC